MNSSTITNEEKELISYFNNLINNKEEKRYIVFSKDFKGESLYHIYKEEEKWHCYFVEKGVKDHWEYSSLQELLDALITTFSLEAHVCCLTGLETYKIRKRTRDKELINF